MFGACWEPVVSVANGPNAGRWNATKRRSAAGNGQMAGIKKKARQQRRTIVFIDESGLSTRPTRARTWAPRGQTPVLHETFNWKSLSIIGGLALWRFYFQIHAGSIKSLQVVEFLRHLQRHIPGKILVIWDGAPIHRSVLVKNYVASTKGRLMVERLPAYAPELNPVEYMWGHLKTHEIANLIATQAWELSFEATAALRRMRRRRQSSPPATPRLICGLDVTLLYETQ